MLTDFDLSKPGNPGQPSIIKNHFVRFFSSKYSRGLIKI